MSTIFFTFSFYIFVCIPVLIETVYWFLTLLHLVTFVPDSTGFTIWMRTAKQTHLRRWEPRGAARIRTKRRKRTERTIELSSATFAWTQPRMLWFPCAATCFGIVSTSVIITVLKLNLSPFCDSWPCIATWMETRPNRQSCPVCKAAISRDKVIPLYGRGGTNKDPRDNMPPRPQGQRTEPENNGVSIAAYGYANQCWSIDSNDLLIRLFPILDSTAAFTWVLGLAPFPSVSSHPRSILAIQSCAVFSCYHIFFSIPLIELILDWTRLGHGAHGTNPANMEDERFLSQLFLWVAILFIFWLLVA